jgi:hypothetical protein
MLEGKARVQDSDMPARMQEAATSSASRMLDLFDVADCHAIAGHIKTAPTWRTWSTARGGGEGKGAHGERGRADERRAVAGWHHRA